MLIRKARLHVFADVQGQRKSLCRIRPPCEFECAAKLGDLKTWSGAVEPFLCVDVPDALDAFRTMYHGLRVLAGDIFADRVQSLIDIQTFNDTPVAEHDFVRHWMVNVPADSLEHVRLSMNNGRTTWISRNEMECVGVLGPIDRDKVVTPGALAMSSWDRKGLQDFFILK